MQLLLTTKKSRVWEIDFLRGICIIFMLFDHFMFNFINVYFMADNWYAVDSDFFMRMLPIAEYYWDWSTRIVIRYIIVFLFLFLSGISCTLTKSNRQRFFKLAAAAGTITLVTYFVDLTMGGSEQIIGTVFPILRHVYPTSMFILFGILHIMAFSLAFYMLLRAATTIKPPRTYSRTLPLATPPTATHNKHIPSMLLTAITCLILAIFFTVYGFLIPFWELSPTALAPLRALQDLRFFWWAVVLAFILITAFLRGFFEKNILSKIIKENNNSLLVVNINTVSWAAISIAGFILLLYFLPIRHMGRLQLEAMYSLFLGTGHFGSDYYGIFPYLGFFLFGAAFGGIFYTRKKSLLPALDGRWNKALSFVGKNALIMYLLHQVVLFAAVMGTAIGVGYTFF